MRVHLKGVHRVQRRLSSGEVRDHYCAWRGGPKINAKPGTPDFIREYNDAHQAIRMPKAATLMTLIAEFKGSADFRQLAPSSIRAYTAYIRLIENEFGDLPLAALNDLRVRGEFKAWRDQFANTPQGRLPLVDLVAHPIVQQGSQPDCLQSVRGRPPIVHRLPH
jgi:hypothetical protein